jgi:hypothetical protein
LGKLMFKTIDTSFFITLHTLLFKAYFSIKWV